jgi:protoporphyrinogen oxidase
VATLEQQLPGLTVCGSWRDGVSISDCIEAGDTRAAHVISALPAMTTAANSAPSLATQAG